MILLVNTVPFNINKKQTCTAECALFNFIKSTTTQNYVFKTLLWLILVTGYKKPHMHSIGITVLTRGSLSLYSWYAWDRGQIPNMAVTGPNR